MMYLFLTNHYQAVLTSSRKIMARKATLASFVTQVRRCVEHFAFEHELAKHEFEKPSFPAREPPPDYLLRAPSEAMRKFLRSTTGPKSSGMTL